MRIAVIGSGISGLGAAYLLSPHHGVDLYEADDRFGGHAHTTDVCVDGVTCPADTGFMVFNHKTYPNLCALFERLGVAEQTANMSFSVTCADDYVEWASSSLDTVFSERRLLLRPRFWAMLRDVIKLDRSARRLLDDPALADITLGQLLDREGYGPGFRHWYLVPMGAAIWSTPTEKMLEFPAASFLRFAHNHGLLYVFGKPPWRSVKGGSRTYVEKAVAAVSGTARTSASVTRVRREPAPVMVSTSDGGERAYDAVVFACHPAQTLAVLEDVTEAERDVLDCFAYHPNAAVLHTDTRFLPTRRRAWSAWNYFAERCEGAGGLSVTYWLTVLQQLQAPKPVLVTINPMVDVAETEVLGRYDYEHPVFDRRAIIAQDRVPDIQGVRNTWHVGAWQRYGFHEDGLWSAVRMAESMGVRAPWPSEPEPAPLASIETAAAEA